jgi:hypothetical protein
MKPLKMDAVIRARWTAALRSGDYEQGYGALRQRERYCCLGVLTDLWLKDGNDELVPNEWRGGETLTSVWDGGDQDLPAPVARWAELDCADPFLTAMDSHASQANDDAWSFAQIADAIDGIAPATEGVTPVTWENKSPLPISSKFLGGKA